MSKLKNKNIIYSVVRDDYGWDNSGDKALVNTAIIAHSRTFDAAQELLDESSQQLIDKGFPVDAFVWRIVGNIYYDK